MFVYLERHHARRCPDCFQSAHTRWTLVLWSTVTQRFHSSSPPHHAIPRRDHLLTHSPLLTHLFFLSTTPFFSRLECQHHCCLLLLPDRPTTFTFALLLCLFSSRLTSSTHRKPVFQPRANFTYYAPGGRGGVVFHFAPPGVHDPSRSVGPCLHAGRSRPSPHIRELTDERGSSVNASGSKTYHADPGPAYQLAKAGAKGHKFNPCWAHLGKVSPSLRVHYTYTPNTSTHTHTLFYSYTLHYRNDPSQPFALTCNIQHAFGLE